MYRYHRKALQRGDTAVIFIFLLLITMVLTTMAIAALTVAGVRGARDISASSQALYSAASGIEYAQLHYNWDTDHLGEFPDNQSTVTCKNDVVVPIVPGESEVRVFTNDGAGGCPTVPEVAGGAKPLCMDAQGSLRLGGVRRRVINDILPAGTSCSRP